MYNDPESPLWLLDRLGQHVASGVFGLIFREVATWRESAPTSRQVSCARGSLLITTNLDNDDALAKYYFERIKRLA